MTIDHLLFGSSDLDRGIEFVEKHLGVRAAMGGVHPGWGTRNALLSLGELCYFEIIAPDPAQRDVPDHMRPLFNILTSSDPPRLIGWIARSENIDALAARLREQKIGFDGPRPGSRQRPDGKLLQWKTVHLHDDHFRVLPFFIDWTAIELHPATDAPKGCQLEHFAIVDPDPEGLKKTCARLGLEVPMERGERPHLEARIRGPKGVLELT
jgi:catechol 2,3-dioxygenase-like lactoylglutathione lyase family enzyme